VAIAIRGNFSLFQGDIYNTDNRVMDRSPEEKIATSALPRLKLTIPEYYSSIVKRKVAVWQNSIVKR
jgi:hypothetical protein